MAADLGVRFQVKGVVKSKETYEKDGQTRYSIRVAYMGGEIEIFGEKAKALFEACPQAGEECLCGGTLQPAGVNRFGRAVFTLEAEAVQSPARRAA